MSRLLLAVLLAVLLAGPLLPLPSSHPPCLFACRRYCTLCGSTVNNDGAGKLQCCSICRAVHYCSRACQTWHWKRYHKNACQPPAQA